MTEKRRAPEMCRARVHGEEMIRDFVFCNLWKPHLTREDAFTCARSNYHGHRWPCTSPRRNQCRHGVFTRPAVCEEIPW